MDAFCLEVTAPKPVLLPTGPSELHRNPFYCHRARSNRTEARFVAGTAEPPDVFPDVKPRSMVESLPAPPGRPSPLEPQRLLGLPASVPLDVGTLPVRLLLERGTRSSSRRGTHRAPRCRGRGPCGTRTAWPISHARTRSPPMHTVPASLGATGGLPAVGCTAPLRSLGVHLLPKPSISQRHEFGRGLLQNEPPMEARPVVAMPLP